MEVRLSRLRLITLLSFATAAAALAWSLWRRTDPIAEGQLWIARDEAGRVREVFGVSADGVGLTMYDSTGQMRLDLGIAPGGTPGLLLLTAGGEPVATINVPTSGQPGIRLTDPVSNARVELAPRADGQPLVESVRGRPDTVVARRPPP
ncbi:MAG: hypothetical protein R2882_02925 [Gemmatimonadales bacterium]